ncbi:MAG: hypothetical protein NZM25_05855 [Leptospiraceae bacterium]|nr:hypothetical protein [Leptospiraceae bacterium]MDW8306701.1 hypothetical protein [Leptospiraceae bacterium]
MQPITLNERELEIRRRVLEPNRPLADRLLVFGITVIVLGMPLLFLIGPGKFVYSFFLVGLLAILSAFALRQKSYFDLTEPKAYVLFTDPKNLREIVTHAGKKEYRLIVPGGPYRVVKNVPIELPPKGKIAVFFHNDKETIFYITRKEWIDKDRLKRKKT